MLLLFWATHLKRDKAGRNPDRVPYPCQGFSLTRATACYIDYPQPCHSTIKYFCLDFKENQLFSYCPSDWPRKTRRTAKGREEKEAVQESSPISLCSDLSFIWASFIMFFKSSRTPPCFRGLSRFFAPFAAKNCFSIGVVTSREQ